MRQHILPRLISVPSTSANTKHKSLPVNCIDLFLVWLQCVFKCHFCFSMLEECSLQVMRVCSTSKLICFVNIWTAKASTWGLFLHPVVVSCHYIECPVCKQARLFGIHLRDQRSPLRPDPQPLPPSRPSPNSSPYWQVWLISECLLFLILTSYYTSCTIVTTCCSILNSWHEVFLLSSKSSL